jgi:hypothetical protein
VPQKWTFNAEKRDNQERFGYTNASARNGYSPDRLVVQVSGGAPGAHKQRRPVQQRINPALSGKIGSTQFFEQGFGPALFLFPARLNVRAI